MKIFGLLIVLFAAETALVSPSRAADQRYPDWPCVQPKVPQMSVAAMWDGPSIADVGNSWQDDPSAQGACRAAGGAAHAARCGAKGHRRFHHRQPAEKQDKAKKLFAGLFDTLSQERSEVMSGIERVGAQREGAGGQDQIRRRYVCMNSRTSRRRTIQNQCARQSSRMEHADLRRPAQNDSLRLRGADGHRTARICAGARDPAIPGMRHAASYSASPVRVWLLAAEARRPPSLRCLPDTKRRLGSPSSARAWRHSRTSSSPAGSR